MLKFLADENFDNTIVRGLIRRNPRVIEVSTDARIGQVIDDILLLVDCCFDGELEGQIYYLPF